MLVLYSDERLLPANIIVDEAIRTTFTRDTSKRIEFHSEFLDLSPFPGVVEMRRCRRGTEKWTLKRKDENETKAHEPRARLGVGRFAQPIHAADTVPVTAENFIRAESDLFFGNAVKEGGFEKFSHRREVIAVNQQFVVRGNREKLYSIAVFDLDAGPVTITMPNAGKRFMSLQIIDEDQYVPNVYYGVGSHTLTREGIGTRYVDAAVRTLVDPENLDDVKQAVAILQRLPLDREKQQDIAEVTPEK